MGLYRKVKFNPVSKEAELFIPAPSPAKNFSPLPKISSKGVDKASRCTPFKDSLSHGYIQETWQDIKFEPQDGGVSYSFPHSYPIIEASEKSALSLTDDFYPVEFTFFPPWVPQLPKGWSALFTHPFNRFDLPFWTPSGIVDTDSFGWFEEFSSFPFYLKKNFSGIIPKGTPFYQIIPIKRSNWFSSLQKHNESEQTKTTAPVRQYFRDGYKKLYWSKKVFR